MIVQIKFFGQVRTDRLDPDAEITANHAPVLDDPVHHDARHVYGDGEANPHISTGAADNGGVDADQASLHIDQCAS